MPASPSPMNVLLIGSGGREHALAWKLAQSPLLGRLFAAPGNPGIARHATCIALNPSRHDEVVAFCREQAITLVVVGPEGPLVEGIADSLAAAGIAVFGPSKAAAQLEGSKGFTKDLCAEFGIPTAAYRRFHSVDLAREHVRERGAPLVVKADGLAAGKGVVVAASEEEALAAVEACFAGAFGQAGAEVVIEEFLEGEEASFFVLTDGVAIVPFATAQDHKRVGEGETGPNTGGMGAYSPAVMNADLAEEVMAKIIRPTVRAMAERGTPYRGVLYAGLMLTKEGPKLIEYNARFGDPETQVLMLRLESDLLPLIMAAAEGQLAGMRSKWRDDVAVTVVMAAAGYPGMPRTGGEINGLAAAEAEKVTIFHAGTALRDGKLIASGGRVLNVSALGATVAEARDRAYRAIDRIDWPDGFCRRDIGWRAIGRDIG